MVRGTGVILSKLLYSLLKRDLLYSIKQELAPSGSFFFFPTKKENFPKIPLNICFHELYEEFPRNSKMNSNHHQ